MRSRARSSTGSRGRSIRRAALRRTVSLLARRLPLSEWGTARGRAVDRHYIDAFVAAHEADIRGRVLEVKDAHYAGRFLDRIDELEIVDVDPSNPEATATVDLAAADALAGDAFDCAIVTQTLQYVYDAAAAVRHLHRILRPGGVLLATVPTTSRVVLEADSTVDQWRFTGASCRHLFGDVFGPANVEVEEHGNLVASLAFLAGLAYEDLEPRVLDRDDPRYPLLVTVRAFKPPG